MTTNYSYEDPGVYVSQINTPVVTTANISPTVICLIGDTQRYTTGQDSYQPAAGTAYTLSQLGINEATIQVQDRFTGTIYNSSAYTITQSASTDGNALDTTTTIEPTSNSPMLPTNGGSGWVYVTYEYTNGDYYQPVYFTNYASLAALYGQPFSSNGSVNSPLSLAALQAFNNGATVVLALPVYTQYTTPQVQDWTNAINSLATYDGIDAIVVVTGNTSVHTALQGFINVQASNHIYTRGFVGQDGTAGSVTAAEIIAEAQGFASNRMIVVSPAVVNYNVGSTGSTINTITQLGGQYVAAALAGLFAGQVGVQVPITHKTVTGFYNIPNQLTNQQTVQMQAAGVCCVYQDRTGRIYVKHGLTTDTSSFLNREISVQAAEDKLYQLITDTLNAQNIIGSVLTPSTPLNVASGVASALNLALSNGLINGYSGITYGIPAGQPTTVSISFQYVPTLPLNYITVQFGIDPSTGTTSFTASLSGVTQTPA